jgi:hypothetical protein
MALFLPNVYQESIYDIDYKTLKDKGIKCLVFDLDNTLGLIRNRKCPKEAIELINRLQKDFIVEICSNNTTKRLKPYLDELNITGTSWSMKPFTYALKKIQKKNHLTKKEMCIIGDQLITDVLAGNRYHIQTVLVNPLGTDHKVTGITRLIENIIIHNYQKKGLFERGKYYG